MPAAVDHAELPGPRLPGARLSGARLPVGAGDAADVYRTPHPAFDDSFDPAFDDSFDDSFNNTFDFHY